MDADESIPYRRTERLLEASGAPWVVIRPNWFMDNFHKLWAEDLRRGLLELPAGDGMTSVIDARDIAAAAAGALASDCFDRRAFDLTGPEPLSYGEALAVLGETERRPLAYLPGDEPGFVARMIRGGMPEDYAESLTAIFEPVRAGWAAKVTGAVEELSGRPPRDLRSYARERAGVPA